jgi:hypothetical protein
MMESFLKTLVSTAVKQFAPKIYESSFISNIQNFLYVKLGNPKILNFDKITLGKFRRNVIQMILVDQSRNGHHKGQFGKAVPHSEHKKWQNQKIGENPNMKPRMYLTYWPVSILHKHNIEIGRYSVRLAIESLKTLFTKNKNKILVYRSATPNMNPLDNTSVATSYRHTLSGALILSITEKWNEITCSILDNMLDQGSNWQEANGGWKQVSDDISIDIWASAYAVKMLANYLSSESCFSDGAKTKAQELFDKTMIFLEEEWYKNNWACGALAPEEHAVLLYIDLVDILKEFNPKLDDECITKFSSWLSPGGDLGENYKLKLSHLPEEQLYARMSYIFYLGDRESNKWRILFQKLSKGDLTKVYTSDLAFALDMSFGYSDNDDDEIQSNSVVSSISNVRSTQNAAEVDGDGCG